MKCGDCAAIPLGDGSPRPSSNQPGRRAGTRPYAAPIRSCTRWGLPCRSCCQDRGALLPHPFDLAGPKTGGVLSVALSLGGEPPAGRYPAPRVPWSPDFPRASFPKRATAQPSGEGRYSRFDCSLRVRTVNSGCAGAFLLYERSSCRCVAAVGDMGPAGCRAHLHSHRRGDDQRPRHFLKAVTPFAYKGTRRCRERRARLPGGRACPSPE